MINHCLNSEHREIHFLFFNLYYSFSCKSFILLHKHEVKCAKTLMQVEPSGAVEVVRVKTCDWVSWQGFMPLKTGPDN